MGNACLESGFLRHAPSHPAHSFMDTQGLFYRHGGSLSMHHADNFDTGVDAGSHDTALKRAEPGRPGRVRLRSRPARAATVLLAAVAALLVLPLQAEAQTAGICGRTETVRTVILHSISGVSNCANVTDAHLAAITGTLHLAYRGITALAAGDFDGLTALTTLYLVDNSLTTLPAGVFDELTALTQLDLDNNSLSTLPAVVFDKLTALTQLTLQGNPVSFGPTADALPDDGTVPVAGGTVTLDGSGSDGGPWGTNVTYSWAARGATVTFDDAASATPVVTIPALTVGTELTFTLTVTPRGRIGIGVNTDTDTDTATVTVTDVAGEVPGVPAAPMVSAASVTSVTAAWTAPANAGPPITDYDYRYRVTSPQGSWTEVTGTTITALSATITGLAENTEYDVQVRATNDEGTSDWSLSGSGSTDANAAPSFTSAAMFDAAENQTAVGTVQASDSDTDDSVTGYAIQGGADRSKFSIVAASGVLTFASAPNFEAPADADADNAYVVVVRAASGTGARAKTADQTITVTVTDVAGEVPGVPAVPTVSAASVTSVTAAWTAPATAGPAITNYDYRYRVTAPQGPWTEVTGTTITALSATITGLAEDTEYDVQVRATNDEGTSGWSASGSGSTNANNTPATGQPTISGVAQQGVLLTVGTAVIEDADGLTNPVYTYQWIREGTDLDGVTGSNYTLSSSDYGKKIQVRVRFTDDANNPETRTSDETLPVAPAAPSVPPTPRRSGAPR